MTPYKKMCSVIISTKSQSYCMTNFSVSLTNLTVHLPQSQDCSCYVRRRVLAPPPLRLQKHADLHVRDFASPPVEWHRPKLSHFTCPLKLGTFWNYSFYTRTCIRRQCNRTSRLSSRSLESRLLSYNLCHLFTVATIDRNTDIILITSNALFSCYILCYVRLFFSLPQFLHKVLSPRIAVLLSQDFSVT